MYSVNQVLGLLTHRPIGWVNFPRKSRVSFNYKSTAGLVASAILATTVAGGVVLQPVTVMAEETDCIWSAEAKDTNEVAFGDKEDWNTWDNTLKATFDGNSKKITKDSVLSFDMIMDTTA